MEVESISSSTTPTHSPSVVPDTRLSRALHDSRLLLLHRSGPTFHVLGSTSNVYTVTISSYPTCSCPDPTTPCKHILFVLHRSLRLHVTRPALRRRFLRPRLLSRLLQTPAAPASFAGPRACRLFRQLFLAGGESRGKTCPVCLEEMGVVGVLQVVTCGACGNSLHGECWERWKRSCRGRRRRVSCVMCRARWRDRIGRERYVNLAAYVGTEEETGGDRSSCASSRVDS